MCKKGEKSRFDEVCESAGKGERVKAFEEAISNYSFDQRRDLKAEAKATNATEEIAMLISVASLLVAGCSLALSMVADIMGCELGKMIFKGVIAVVVIIYALYLDYESKKNKERNFNKECILLAIENIENDKEK